MVVMGALGECNSRGNTQLVASVHSATRASATRPNLGNCIRLSTKHRAAPLVRPNSNINRSKQASGNKKQREQDQQTPIQSRNPGRPAGEPAGRATPNSGRKCRPTNSRCQKRPIWSKHRPPLNPWKCTEPNNAPPRPFTAQRPSPKSPIGSRSSILAQPNLRDSHDLCLSAATWPSSE